ncbi:DUF3306 domain-containing protein [Ramlibacter albus]|uniref:DUF3306 domain-containing protein n=1 Tax=Ramlibacter albus TaxID=2079448 RepID=A0A923M9M0_9BURK|nr:DUF3306 domain-containing protein [Ramlibacter albus]MBC5765433.1 DUF3306 domain-containing protein [Ramlibacter albus]
MSDDGFFSRWSKRKQEVKAGREVEPEPTAPPAAPVVANAPIAEELPAPAEPLPTLDDAQALTPESDFRRFVAGDVPHDVRNTALKKLFADPRFNVQDGLDVYIDDYSKPDPIPPAMLRQLASAQFLDLFDEKKKKEQEDEEGREAADDPTDQSVAQSPQAETAVPPDADPDLRLQQDDAPGPAGPGERPE